MVKLVAGPLHLNELFDVAVIGGGPAGMSAALFAASEGMRVVLLEAGAMLGGNARYSNRIENFLGFPHGLSGADFASAGHAQLLRFGVTILLNHVVNKIERSRFGADIADTAFVIYADHRARFQQKTAVHARAIIVATGTVLNPASVVVPGLETHPNVHIGETAMVLPTLDLAGQEVAVIGGGNSAGQAALWLEQYADKVHILIRGSDLRKSMSQYLVDRIEESKNVAVWTEATIERIYGVTVKVVRLSDSFTYEFDRLFFFTGTTPVAPPLSVDYPINREHEQLEQDSDGYVYSYSGFETSVTGVFVVGDIRSGATRRVASAVGEGAAVISQIHKYLSR